jgi:adenylate kinase family enzyme
VQYQNYVLSFQRGQFSRVASFLKGARCIGFGGHVTEGDADMFGYADRGIRACAAREIQEELRRPFGEFRIDENSFELLGILNDDSSDVGRKHVAIVMRYWVDNWDRWKSIQEGEASVRKLEWTNFARGDIDFTEFEYWSQMCFRRYFPELPAQHSQFRIVREVDLESDHLLLIVGTIGSGKTHTARLLATKMNYAVISSGHIAAKLLGMQPIPNTSRAELQKVAWDLVSNSEGSHRLAEAIVEAARATGRNRVIVDGVRQLSTFESLKSRWQGPVYTLFVQTPPDLAFELYRLREAELPVREFMDLYDAPVERGVHDIARQADILVYNWFGEESHRRAVEALVSALGRKGEESHARRRL